MNRCNLCTDPGQIHTYHHPPPLCCRARQLFDMPASLRTDALAMVEEELSESEWRAVRDDLQARIDEAL